MAAAAHKGSFGTFNRRFAGRKRERWTTLDLDLGNDDDCANGIPACGSGSGHCNGGVDTARTSAIGPSSGDSIVAMKPQETALACLEAPRGPRASARPLLARVLHTVGRASAEEAHAWSLLLEGAIWQRASVASVSSNAILDEAEEDVEDPEQLPAAALRFYRREVRRLCAAFKDEAIACGVVARLRGGGDLETAESIVALPPEDLLSDVKRARLLQLRTGPPEETGVRRYMYKDETMKCEECGEIGAVRYDPIASVKEGFAKAETWGSKEGDSKGPTYQAQCGACLAEWMFER
eukprot:TRINITY_DN64538_c0_g1_i1.p1 TRINITY_DN64538_c0_g1~~TRINITY_DN64538_c0_g1_i1.p1  ORF type:complete len:294 (+),score=48.09 TRINITY_DN64538_c0_g1_i1:68-949(+)